MIMGSHLIRLFVSHPLFLNLPFAPLTDARLPLVGSEFQTHLSIDQYLDFTGDRARLALAINGQDFHRLREHCPDEYMRVLLMSMLR